MANYWDFSLLLLSISYEIGPCQIKVDGPVRINLALSEGTVRINRLARQRAGY
jgi:hypothetical protein